MQIQITVPKEKEVLEKVESCTLTPRQLFSFTMRVAKVAEGSILDFLSRHIRTGQTIGSIRIRPVEVLDNKIVLAVGTDTRALQLRVLDRGRREVYPVKAKRLRFMLWPSQIVIFAMRSRAVPASGIMKQSAELAFAQSRQLADDVLRKPKTM